MFVWYWLGHTVSASVSCVAPCWSEVPKTRVCVQSVLDGLGCHKKSVGYFLSENGSGEWTEGLNKAGSDLDSSNRRSRLNWAARDIQRLPQVLRYEPSGCPPERVAANQSLG